MTGNASGKDEFAAIAAEVRAHFPGSAADAAAQAGRERIRAAIDRAGQARRWRAVVIGSLALAAAGTSAVLLVVRPRTASLTAELDGSPVAAGDYVRAAEAPVGLAFSDGTRVALHPAARARIAAIGADGARVALEHGRARFDVRRRPGAKWQVDAGPFAILVTGTSFEAAWSAEDERLEVRLHHGGVIVQGPLDPGGTALRAGQRLVAQLRDRQFHVGDIPAEPATEAPAEKASERPPVPAEPERARAAAPSWSRRVALGDFAGVLASARARGLERCMRACSSEDLTALADAARYSGDATVARTTLQAIRRRFPRSERGRAASFLLGRMAEDQGGAPAVALRWYEAYLRESPAGSLVEEAAGRRMVLLKAVHGSERARDAARDYLARYSGGAYAPAAREILGR